MNYLISKQVLFARIHTLEKLLLNATYNLTIMRIMRFDILSLNFKKLFTYFLIATVASKDYKINKLPFWL